MGLESIAVSKSFATLVLAGSKDLRFEEVLRLQSSNAFERSKVCLSRNKGTRLTRSFLDDADEKGSSSAKSVN